MRSTKKGRRAVVLGGGIAGLAASSVLSRHFEEVMIVERDAYSDGPSVRPHAAQGAHVHVLLAKGLEVLSRLVPDLSGWLDEMGLREGDLTHHLRSAYDGKWLPKARSGVPFRPCTRPEIEYLLRRNAKLKSNIAILGEHKALRLLGHDRIKGVRVLDRHIERDIEADFVVDAMGRGSISAPWFEAAGAAKAPEEMLDAGVVYSSCQFEPPADIDDDWVLLGVSARVPTDPNLGAIMRLGPNRMLAAFISYGRPKPPRSPAELVAKTADLCVPELHRLLRASRPVTDIAVFGNTFNRWRHFGKLAWLPDGLVSIGDAVCSLNPRYGQGMTVAALSADRLDRDLDTHFDQKGSLDGFAHAFQKGLEETLQIPWQMAVMEDRLWVSAFSGKAPTLQERLIMKGSERLLRLVFSDVDAFRRFMRVAHLIDSPLKLMNPSFLSAVLRGRSADETPVLAPRIGSLSPAPAQAA